METKKIVSEKGTLQGRDFSKGALVGGLTAAIYSVIEVLIVILTHSAFTEIVSLETLTKVGVTFLTAFLAYLLKNGAIEPTKVIFEHKDQDEDPDAVQPLSGGRPRPGGNPPPIGDPTHPRT